jgi:hypothetical protein
MRRWIVLFCTASLAMSLAGSAPAGAKGGDGIPEEYDSIGLSASWSAERKSSGKEYIRITWYLDAYQTIEAGQPEPDFWSSVSRNKERCTRSPGRDRCRFLLYEYGSIRNVGGGLFSVNADLTGGAIEATYALKFVDGKRVDHPRSVRFAATFRGSGETYRTTDEYTTYEDDCLLSEYSSEYSNREAEALGELDGRNLGPTDDGYLSTGHSVYTEYDCSEADAAVAGA